jgi:glucokinase
LGLPVFADNDVNLGTLGEFEMGAARGARDTVGIFVGTGVGGGLVVNGQLHRGFRYAGAELGHMIVVPNGPLCSCGRRGCLEAVASRTAIEREVRTGLAAGLPTIIGELIAQSKRDRLTSGVIAKAVRAGDPLILDVMKNVQFYLGLLTANLVNLLDPEVVVFGGGVVEALGDEFLAPIRSIARPNFKMQHDAGRVRIVPAKLGDHAAVLGAVIMAGQQLAQRGPKG